MNSVCSKYLPWLSRMWRDEACAGTVEGAILACGMAAAALFAAFELRSPLIRILELVVGLPSS